MTKRLRVIAIVIGLLAVFSGNVSAYSEENLNVTIIEGNKKSTANLTEPMSVKKLLELQEISISEDDDKEICKKADCTEEIYKNGYCFTHWLLS